MYLTSLVLVLSLMFFWVTADYDPAHRRFEYKYSFKDPHVTLPDGTIPFWEIHGDAIPGPDEIRLVPSLKNHRGSAWTKNSASFSHWEVELSLRITGHGRQGAEGMAFWYTKEPGGLGPVYGSADSWDGVGIIFDTFDHDFKGNNPAIIIVGNNGKLQYDHLRIDLIVSQCHIHSIFGEQKIVKATGFQDSFRSLMEGDLILAPAVGVLGDGSSQALGTCVENFRNTVRPFRARIKYYQKTLQVSVYTGFSPSGRAFQLCAEVPNMVIPSTGYFGISAATSAIADDHDVMSFVTYSLSTTWEETSDENIPAEERERFEKEFDEFQKDLEKNMEDFHKSHPVLDEDAFESDSQRELEMVLYGQARLLEELRVLKTRLNMTLEDQFRYREILRKSAANETTTVGTEHVHNTLDTVMNGMPDLLAMTKDLKNHVLKIAAKAKDLSSSKEGASPPPTANITKEVKEDFNKIKTSLHSLVKRSENSSPCPPSTSNSSCLSSGVFLMFLLLQSVCTVAYVIYRGQTNSGSKKFY